MIGDQRFIPTHSQEYFNIILLLHTRFILSAVSLFAFEPSSNSWDTATQHSIRKNKSILSTSDKFNLKRV